MDLKAKATQDLRERALQAIADTQVLSRMGQGAFARDDCQSPGLVHFASTQWGTPIPFFLHKGNAGATTRTHWRYWRKWRSAWNKLASKCGNRSPRRNCLRVTQMRMPRTTRKPMTRSTCGSTQAPRSIPSWPRLGLVETIDGWQAGRKPTCTWKARTSIAAGFILRCWSPAHCMAARAVRGLLTHGFTVDGQGRKMSKSLGNTVVPQKISDTLGAEILRLWTGAHHFSGELSISDEILKRVVESYRRIHNTLRFLLANISADLIQRRRNRIWRGLRYRQTPLLRSLPGET